MILVVDDDAVTARIWTHLLGRLRRRAVVVASGGEALRVLLSEPIDAIVCALVLPDMSGLTLIARCRGLAHMADLPVIVCTGQADTDSVQRALALGVADFLVKPVRADHILPRVQRVLHAAPPRWETRRETVRRLQVSTPEVMRLIGLAHKDLVAALTLVDRHLAATQGGPPTAGDATPSSAAAAPVPETADAGAATEINVALLRARDAAATVGARRCAVVLNHFLPLDVSRERLQALRHALAVEIASFTAALPSTESAARVLPVIARKAYVTPSGAIAIHP